MAFPVGWTSYQIKTDPTKVSGSSNLTDFPALISSANLSSAVYAGLQQGGSNVTATNLETSGTGTDATSFDTGSISPTLGRLVLVSVSSVSTASAPVNIPTVSGAGMTWTQVATALETENSYRRITLFRGVSVGNSGALTLDFAGESQLRCGWSITEINNVDTGGTNGANAIVQSATAVQSDAGSYTGLTVTLGAFSSTNNATFGAVQQQTGGVITPGSGFTELGETSALDSIAVTQTQWKNSNDTSVDWSWASGVSRATAIAIELKYKNQGGEDLRITTDSAGTTEIPFEIVSLDTVAETCEIWTKIPTLDYDDNTSIYIWYGNANALPYSASDTYGSQAVWSDYAGVFHLNNNLDSTSYSNSASNIGTPTYTTGKIGNGFSLDGSSDALQIPDGAELTLSNGTLQAWANPTSIASSQMILTSNLTGNNSGDFRFWLNTSGYLVFDINNGTSDIKLTGDDALSTSTWSFASAVFGTGGMKIYKNGVLDNSNATTTAIGTVSWDWFIGVWKYTASDLVNWFVGMLDEIRICSLQRSADFQVTEYNNQNDPGSFWVTSINYTETYTESISLADSLLRYPDRTLLESLSIVDSIINSATFNRIYTETLSIIDNMVKLPSRIFTDNLLVADSLLRLPSRNLSESVSVTDTLIKIPGRILSETVSLIDSIIRFPKKVITNTINLVDTFTGELTGQKVLAETIRLVDTFNTSFQRSLSEALSVTDNLIKEGQKRLSESLTILDTFERGLFKVITETVTITDTFITSMQRVLSETITLVDSVIKSSLKQLQETITLVDNFNKGLFYQISETLSLTDTINNIRTAFKSLTESVSILDTIANLHGKLLSETISLTDSITRSVNGVLVSGWVRVNKAADVTWTRLERAATVTWNKVGKAASVIWTRKGRP